MQEPRRLIKADAREQPDKARVLADGVQQRIIAEVNEPGIPDPARLLEALDRLIALAPLRVQLGLLVQDAISKLGYQL